MIRLLAATSAVLIGAALLAGAVRYREPSAQGAMPQQAAAMPHLQQKPPNPPAGGDHSLPAPPPPHR